MIDVVAAWMGAIGSIIAIGILVFQGGALVEKQAWLVTASKEADARIKALEGEGPQSLIAHAKLNDEQQRGLEARIKRLEEIVCDIPKITSILAKIETDMDYLTGRKRVPSMPHSDTGAIPNYQPSAMALPSR